MSSSEVAIRFWDLPNNTDPRWWKDKGMRTGVVHLCILFCTIYSLGYDGSLLTGLQALESWNKQFNHPHGTSLGLIAASYYLPKIPSGFIIAMIIDWYGRKIPLYIGAILMLAGAIGCGLANTVPQLIGGRILLGVGTAFAQITACALVPELAHPRIRAVANSFLNVTYFIGSIFASWLTFAMVYYPKPESSWSWRIPALVQGFGPIILAVGVWFVPQSPRWLVKHGRVDEAHEILAKYHANGDLNDDLVLFELRQIQVGVDIERINDSSSWLSWFRTPGNRRRLLVIFLLGTSTQWLGNVIGYFLVPVLKQVGITSSAEQAGINGGISIWSWWSAIAGALTAERFGRRRLFLCSLFGCLASFAFITGFSGGYARTKQPSVGVAIVPFLFLFHSAYAVAFTPLPMMYTPEIVPFALRAKAASLLLFFQNCAQSFNQYVNPVALDAIGWKYFLVWIGANIFYIVTFWLFVKETKGLTVEEAAVLYDPDYVRHAAMEEERRLHQSHAFEAKHSVQGEIKEDEVREEEKA